MNSTRKLMAVLFVALMITVCAEGAVAKWAEGPGKGEAQDLHDEVPAPFRQLKALVDDLKTVSTDPRDDDNDGLVNSIELIIGTEPQNPDSDFDGVPDQEEVDNGMDPSEPDSNRDGLGDWFEVRDASTDIDGDGLHNAWDWDNDGDGVDDGLDMSPNSRTPLGSSVHFNVAVTGEALYLYFQVRPSNPDNLMLVDQVWDWPSDTEGSMRDLDNSLDDVVVAPLLLMTGDTLPTTGDMALYGAQAQGDVAYMPLFPVWDYGNVVAFKSQMFFSACATRTSLSFDLSLKWKVSGYTDNVVKALKYSSGRFLSAADAGPVKVNATDVRAAQELRWMDQGNGRVSMLASNGLFLSVGADGKVRASAMEMHDAETFTIVNKTGGGKALRASNGLYLTVKADGTVVADATALDSGGDFTIVNMAPKPSITTLAFYEDSFTLTGCYFEESRGTDVGVFWPQTQKDGLATGLMMAYNFLRNSTTTVSDMTRWLTDEGVGFGHSEGSYGHRDLAVQALASDLLPAASDSLPAGDAYPIVTIMSDSYAAVQLYNMTGGGHLTSAYITADLGSIPVVVAKTMKSNWFKQGEDQEVPIADIVVGMRSWEMDNEDLINLIGLTMAWNAGEKTITQIGPAHITFKYSEIDSVGPTVKSVMKNGLSGLKGLATALKVIDSIYACVKFVKLAPFAKPTGIMSAVKMFQTSFKTAGAMKTGWLGSVNKACKYIEIIGLVIDIGFALYTLYAIGEAYGWTQVGTGIAVLYSVMMIAYAVVLFAIGQIPIVGWIIALIIALSDAIVGWITGTGWSQRLMEAIIDAITDFKTRSQPDIQMTGADVNIDDKDKNSLDVGDTIEYTSYIVGWVNITEDGSYQDLVDSYVTPFIEVSVPSNSSSTTGRSTAKGAETFTATSKRTEYTAKGWATPGTPMVNYPMTITLKANYTCYYDECWWIIFYGWDCNRESTSDVITVDPSTIYFDVMPGTIDAFAAWTALRSCDHDGDGLNDTEEVETDPWKWDTDADGLGDAYELDIGTDPTEFDTDDDGLDDKQEIQLGCDPNMRDSDEDGLEDYFEYAGWIVYFDYCGQAFDWYINSSPGFNNTDGDLLDDYLEYVCLLNPRSPDTDGNGWPDDVRDYYKTTFEFRYYMAEAGKPYAVAVDPSGNLFTTTWDEFGDLRYIVKWKPDGSSSLFATLPGDYESNDMATDASGNLYVQHGDAVFKFSPAGALLATMGNSGTYVIEFGTSLAIGANGTIYVAEVGSDMYEPGVIMFDRTGAFLRKFGTHGSGVGQLQVPTGVCLDADGRVYVVDDERARVLLFQNDGTFVAEWGSPGAGTGQFRSPGDAVVDGNGDVLVVDTGNNRIQKFNDTGRWIATFGSPGNGDGEFATPTDIYMDAQGEFYVSDKDNYRVQKFGQRVEFIKAEPRYPFTDTDGDGVPDVLERAERTIVIVSAQGIAGIQMLNVTSDPNVPDTDGDGVPDGDEYRNQTDPRSPDTDMDGITDLDELRLGTNLTHYDTDLDGLEDGIEITFMSDPLLQDTDGDGVKDAKEFALGIDPRSRDTDRDGLMDADELLAGSDPRGPDTDADGLFDSYELQIGTRPTLSDNDGDGLIDGYEQFYGTDPRSEDSDDDGLGDDFEVDARLNPLSNDTDSDGVKDARELELGLNPRSRDSDGDKVLDNVDTDYEVVLPEGVIVTTDADSASMMLADALSAKVKVTQVTPAELLASHKGARYIVVVGDPAGIDGTAGGLIRTLLADSGDLAARMAGSYELRIVMRFGVWAQTQTIVLVTNAQPTDAIRVLGMLRSMRATVEGATIDYQYLNERSCFWFEEVDLLKLTDVSLSGKLDEMALFDVKLSKFTDSDTPHKLDRTSGLDALYNPTGRYVQIDFSDNVYSPERDILSGLELKMYYTAADLDLTGDGDGDDPTDINESTLAAYWYNETSSKWERLDTDMGWVLGLELNTTDVELYGNRYAGCFLVKLAHASLIGQAGLPKGFVPTVARTGPDKAVFVSEEVVLDGSGSEGNGALNYTWTFRYRLGRVTLFGASPDFVFEEPGEYAITLTVLDSLGATDSHTMRVTVAPVTEKSFTLAIGPVLDDIGRPVEGVRARLTIATLSFVKPTGADGYAPLMLSESFIGMPVIIRFIKSGFQPLEYQTTITVGKALETPPPPFRMVRVPTVAGAGADIHTSLGNLTQFDGTESEGNGGIVTYKWTVTFPGGSGSIILNGPSPTHTFLSEGVYDVTLNVTDILGVTAEDSLKVTVGPRWSPTFLLGIGPIVDSKGRVLGNVSVRITVGRDVYSNTTNALGMALVEVPTAAIGPDVWVSLVSDKYGTVQYKTTITADKALAQPPAAMTAKKAPAAREGAISTGLAAGLVLVLVLVLVAIAFLVIRRRRGPPAEDGAAEVGLEPATVDPTAQQGSEEIGLGLPKDDGAPKGADEAAEAPGSEGERAVSRPVTHQRGRGKAPPKAMAPAPRGGVPLKEQEAESEIETD